MDDELTTKRAALTQAYTNFVQVAQRLAPQKREQGGVCGDWSPREVVAHLTGWDSSLHSYITAPEQFDPPVDVHAFNARSVTERQHLSWEATIEDLQDSFQALQQALTTVTPEMKMYDRVSSWLDGRRADYELHIGQLEAWI